MKTSRKILFKLLMLAFMVVFGIFSPSIFSGNGNNEKSDGTIDNAYVYSDNDDLVQENNRQDNETNNSTERNVIYQIEEYDEETERQINNIITTMSVEEKVGQLLFIKDDNRFNKEILEKYPVGGIILFASDFRGKSPENLTNWIKDFQDNSTIPLLIGTDEEGGPVIRLSKYSALSPKVFTSPANLYSSGGMERIKEDTIEKSKLLLSYGINVNFAPVCDVSVNSGEYMYNRAFGKNAFETASYVREVVSVMNNENIGSVLKHFPGYGGNGDTHDNAIRDKREYQTFVDSDFLPFEAGIEEGADCVLISHNIVECIDDNWPASLSVDVHNILRNELNFKGVVITDDLMMKGISSYINDEEAVVKAITAGNDMILVADYEKSYKSLMDAVNNNEIPIEQIDNSIRRILRWKIKLGLFDDVNAPNEE